MSGATYRILGIVGMIGAGAEAGQDSLPTRLPFWVSRHFLTIGEPWRLMRSSDMHRGCHAWIVIERCHPEDDMRLGWSLGDELCSTNRTKAAQLPR